jgi:hypothetical protein
VPDHISAVESISPAFARTKQMLFRPFRFGLWARLAVVSLITGEMGSGGGSSANFNGGQGGSRRWTVVAHLLSEPRWEQIQPYLFWIVLGVCVGLALLLLWVYSDCVFRFILFDSVLTGQCRLRESWRRWREAGRRYFLWVIAFGVSALVLVGLVVGVPVLLAFRAGWFEKSSQHLGALIGGGVLLVLVFFVLVVVLAIIDLLSRDFLIPVMALEEVGPLDGWNRLLDLMAADKLAYAGYVLMKIVLAVGSAIIFTIVNLIVILVLLIPLGLLGIAGYFIGKGAGLTWDLSTILFVAGVGMLGLAGILYALGFVYAPGLVFFQSYTLEFFASRYGPLASKMFPPKPPVTPSLPPIVPGTAIPPLAPGGSYPV